MEFAVIQTGGKQYKVSKGSLVSIEKIIGEYKKGDKLTFDKVLLVDKKDSTTLAKKALAQYKAGDTNASEITLTQVKSTIPTNVSRYVEFSNILTKM